MQFKTEYKVWRRQNS